MILVTNMLDKKSYRLEGPITVARMLEELGIAEDTVLVSRGETLLTRDVCLEDGDRVRLIPVISGGGFL